MAERDRKCSGNYKYSKVGIIAYQRVITADNGEIFNKKSHQLELSDPGKIRTELIISPPSSLFLSAPLKIFIKNKIKKYFGLIFCERTKPLKISVMKYIPSPCKISKYIETTWGYSNIPVHIPGSSSISFPKSLFPPLLRRFRKDIYLWAIASDSDVMEYDITIQTCWAAGKTTKSFVLLCPQLLHILEWEQESLINVSLESLL